MKSNNIEIFESKPKDFNSKVDVAAAYLEIDGKILFLQLSERKEYFRRWGVPAGKFEREEAPESALRRELFEETGISFSAIHSVQSIGQLYIRKPKLDYVFHAFKVHLKHLPEIVLSDEHIAYRWVSPEEAKTLDLLDGAEYALEFYRSHSTKISEIDFNAERILKKEFYFIRHGQTDYNLLGNKTDHPDVSLNAMGRNQAQKIAPLVVSLSIDTICFSPFQRAKETKDIISINMFAKEREISNLGECSLNIWQEMTSLGSKALSCGSKSVQAFMNRVIDGVNLALDQEGQILIVAHGGIHWALCCLLNVEQEWIIDNCVPVHFSYQGDKWTAKKLL